MDFISLDLPSPALPTLPTVPALPAVPALLAAFAPQAWPPLPLTTWRETRASAPGRTRKLVTSLLFELGTGASSGFAVVQSHSAERETLFPSPCLLSRLRKLGGIALPFSTRHMTQTSPSPPAPLRTYSRLEGPSNCTRGQPRRMLSRSSVPEPGRGGCRVETR